MIISKDYLDHSVCGVGGGQKSHWTGPEMSLPIVNIDCHTDNHDSISIIFVSLIPIVTDCFFTVSSVSQEEYIVTNH